MNYPKVAPKSGWFYTTLNKHDLKRILTHLLGQATSYKVGELHIRQLRRQLEIELRQNFDLRAFHSAVLHCLGPLDGLEGCVRQRMPPGASTSTTTTKMTTMTETTSTTHKTTHGFWANATQATTTTTTAETMTTSASATTTTTTKGHTPPKNSAKSANFVNLEVFIVVAVVALLTRAWTIGLISKCAFKDHQINFIILRFS